MKSDTPIAKPAPQINIRLEPEQFKLIGETAKLHNLTPVHFCRDAALRACNAPSPPAANAIVSAMRDIIDNLAALISTVHKDNSQAHDDLQAQLTWTYDEMRLALLATLQETLALRTIADNHAATVFTAEDEMKQLRMLADTTKARLASKTLAPWDQSRHRTPHPIQKGIPQMPDQDIYPVSINLP